MRSRWAAIGAAVAVSIGAGSIGWIANAATPAEPSSFVPITPCRLFDTRSGADNVGDRATPLGFSETFERKVWGTNGDCVIPSTATSVTYNVTVVDPTVTGFLTIFPSDRPMPTTSAINPIADGGTKANAGTVGLSATGRIKIFNQTGPIDALFDVTGYYIASSEGPAGPPGAQGPPGNVGDPGPSGMSGYEIVRGETASPDGADGVYWVQALCPTGKLAVGGGGSQGASGWSIDDSRPMDDGVGWEVQYARLVGSSGGIGEAWAVCVTVTSDAP